MRSWSTYPTSAVLAGGSSGPDGSITAPWQATGASASAVLTALAALTAANGDYAAATITGQAPRLMQYVAADSAWYATDGGDGSQLAPYWTTSTGEDGIDALPAAGADAYGVIAKGSGSPQTLRRLTLIADGALSTGATASGVGALLPGPIREWVSSTLHARGTPATCYVMDRATGSWSASAPAGSQFNWNSTVSSRLAVRAGTATENVVSIGTRSASTATALLVRRAKVTGASIASGGGGYLQSISSSDSGQYAGLGYGGTGAANATNWQVFTGTPGFTDTAIALATECSLEAVLDLATNAISVRKDGASAATWSGTSTATTASSVGSRIGAAVQNSAQTTISFRTFYAMEW